MTKICSKCGAEKELGEFYKSKSGKFGVRGACTECTKVYNATHKEEKRIYYAAYYMAHAEERRAYYANYHVAHAEETKAYNAIHAEERAALRDQIRHDIVLRITGKTWSGDPFHLHHLTKTGRDEDRYKGGRKLGGISLYYVAIRFCEQFGDEAGRLRYSIEFPGDHALKHAYKREIEIKDARIAELEAILAERSEVAA